MTHHQLSARVNGGRIEAVAWQEASGDSVLGFTPYPDLVARVVGFDPGAASGAWISYDIPHRETTVWRRRMPLATGQWRGLGLAPNLFAIESFLDEAAYAAGKDPLQFRLDHLPSDADGQRMAAMLNAAAEQAGWRTPLPAP
jgi:isoquinoline 1-oxidoreductase beta subunit